MRKINLEKFSSFVFLSHYHFEKRKFDVKYFINFVFFTFQKTYFYLFVHLLCFCSKQYLSVFLSYNLNFKKNLKIPQIYKIINLEKLKKF